jgi:hypothetical protein
MSIFDYPRINFQGTIQLNPGTANNDDYAQRPSLVLQSGPHAGDVLALIDSKLVQPRRYGMSDADFMAWVQKTHTFDVAGQPGQTQEAIPAEWNYYGGMDMNNVAAQIIGITTGPGETYTQPDGSVPVTSLLGAALTFANGHITDVNSEGSPPATQFFIDQLTLAKDDTTFISGSASKGACQWLNFYRNVNMTADGGAGGYVYHVIMKSPGTTINIPGFDDPNIVGVILRYYLYALTEGATTNAEIEALYEQQQTNPATLEIVGTFAPLYANETIFTSPTGRLMVCNQPQIPTPGTNNNGAPGDSEHNLFALAPAVLRQSENIISADFVGTFPDYYQGGAVPPSETTNPKFDFGDVSLFVSAGSNSALIGAVDYTNTIQGDQAGWVLDFDISANQKAQQVLADANASFQLMSSSLGTVLEETDYYFVSNQQGIYAEQFGNGSEFLNQGTLEPASVSVFSRGLEISADQCPPFTVWQYRSIPLQDPGNAIAISTNQQPGQPIVVDTSQPGNFLFTFSVNDDLPAGFPPQSYLNFMNPPFVTNSPSISLRILPNDEDFSQYYVDPNAPEPVGNDLLTFDLVYEKVLRTYYLLYPVMIPFVQLNCEKDVAKNAQAILQVTDQSIWMTDGYMPRTRDMSASRTTLLQAWCRKVQGGLPSQRSASNK